MLRRWQRLEVINAVERCRLFVFDVHQDGIGRDFASKCSCKSVHQQLFTESAAMMPLIYG